MILVQNAIYSIEDLGTIWLETGMNREKVFRKIRDNGKGINKDKIERLFDPSFTTKGNRVGAEFTIHLPIGA
ncbi:MAG TPA: hypothetical protein DEG71_07455 [Clostridiales bacterium]|nr:hypothetical protein [Clostridiales bacterium]